MYRHLISLTFALSLSLTSHAIVLQRVILKNGSQLNGYVQQAAAGVLTFHTDDAMIVVGNIKADITEQATPIARLDSAWIEWGTRNEAFQGNGEARTLNLSNILLSEHFGMTQGEEVADSLCVDNKDTQSANSHKHNFYYYLQQKHTISGVRVLEKGAQLRYLEKTPNTYTFTWDDVASIRIDRRPRTALSGIDCIYELRSGNHFEGQPAGETQQTLSLYIDGTVQSFDIDDVIKYNYKGINPKQDILEQSELLDVVRKHNGTSIRGIIIEQNYSSNSDKDNYILIRDANKSIHSLRIAEVAEIMKEPNPDFKPISDVILQEGQVLVARKQLTPVNVVEHGYVLTLDSIAGDNVISVPAGPRASIVVEYPSPSGQNIEMFRLVRLTPTKSKRSTIYTFTYKDLSEASVQPSSITTSVNNTTRTEYIIPSANAFYALYNDKTRTAIPLIIKQ